MVGRKANCCPFISKSFKRSINGFHTSQGCMKECVLLQTFWKWSKLWREGLTWLISGEVHRQTRGTHYFEKKLVKWIKIVCNMAPYNVFCFFSVHLIHLVVFPCEGYIILSTQDLDLIHRNSVVTATGKILEWVSAAEPLSFGQTCLPFPLAHSCGANAALSQPHHRKTQKPGMSRSRWRNWRGHVLPKKLDLFKDLFHSDPSVLSRGDTSVSGGRRTENRYNWELSFCGQNACSVAAFPWPRLRSSPQELYRIPWECCHKHAHCTEHTSHLLRLNHCVTANTHESNHSVSTWAQIQARFQFSTPLFTMWYNIRWCYIIYYNVIWCDTMHCKTIRYQTIWYDTIWYDTIWCNMIPDDTMRCDAIPNDTIRYHTMWCINKNSKWCKHYLLPLWTQSQKIKKRQWKHNVHTKKYTRKVSEINVEKKIKWWEKNRLRQPESSIIQISRLQSSGLESLAFQLCCLNFERREHRACWTTDV